MQFVLQIGQHYGKRSHVSFGKAAASCIISVCVWKPVSVCRCSNLRYFGFELMNSCSRRQCPSHVLFFSIIFFSPHSPSPPLFFQVFTSLMKYSSFPDVASLPHSSPPLSLRLVIQIQFTVIFPLPPPEPICASPLLSTSLFQKLPSSLSTSRGCLLPFASHLFI